FDLRSQVWREVDTWQWEARRQGYGPIARACHGVGILAPGDGLMDEVGYLVHLCRAEAARRDRGRAEPDPTRAHGWLWIEWYGILVSRDMDSLKRRLGIAPRNAQRAHIHEHQVVVSATGNQAEAFLLKRSRQGLGVSDDVLLVFTERWLERFLEGDSLG